MPNIRRCETKTKTLLTECHTVIGQLKNNGNLSLQKLLQIVPLIRRHANNHIFLKFTLLILVAIFVQSLGETVASLFPHGAILNLINSAICLCLMTSLKLFYHLHLHSLSWYNANCHI